MHARKLFIIAMAVLWISPLFAVEKVSEDTADAKAISALINRLQANAATDRDAATQELIRIGKPAAKVLVETLGDPSQAKRIAAATALREMFARRKDARPNDHGEAYWRARISKIKFGDLRKEVYGLLPPDPPLKDGEVHAGAVIGSGRTEIESYRLDDYWSVTVSFHIPGTVSALPSLRNDPKRIWIDPPKNYTGEWNGWFVNGRKATCNHYKNGKYDGVLSWYRTNGRMIFQQQYKGGVITGDEAGWHEDGKKSYTGQYDKNGKRTGKWTHWFESGQMHSRTEHLAGKFHGLRELWHENGQLRYQDHYQNGVKHGVSRAFDMGGAVLWQRMYRNGEIVEQR